MTNKDEDSQLTLTKEQIDDLLVTLEDALATYEIFQQAEYDRAVAITNEITDQLGLPRRSP